MESKPREITRKIKRLIADMRVWFLIGGGLVLAGILVIALFLLLPPDELPPQPGIEVPVVTVRRPATTGQAPEASTNRPPLPIATATPAGAYPTFHPIRSNEVGLIVTSLGVMVSSPDILVQQAVVAQGSTGPVIMALAPGVLYCEHAVVFAPGAVTETMSVRPEFYPYVGVRQITVYPAQKTLSWGCQIPSGKILPISLMGYFGEQCKKTEWGWVVDIVSFPEETLLLISDDCWRLQNTKMVWIDNQTGLETRSKSVGLTDNWIVFGKFVCAGGAHPQWKLCVSTQTGEQVSPSFSSTKSITIKLGGE